MNWIRCTSSYQKYKKEIDKMLVKYYPKTIPAKMLRKHKKREKYYKTNAARKTHILSVVFCISGRFRRL